MVDTCRCFYTADCCMASIIECTWKFKKWRWSSRCRPCCHPYVRSNIFILFVYLQDIFQASSFELLKLENLLRSAIFTFIYNRSAMWISYIFHIISLHGEIWTQQIDLVSDLLLHSSVGRASHQCRGSHGFESRWSHDIYQASYFQLLKLENLLRWSLFTSICNRRTI